VQSDLPVHEAVIASCSIPGIFTPRRIVVDGRPTLAIDGGSAGVGVWTDDSDGLRALFAYSDADYAERDDVAHASALSVLALAVQLLLNQQAVERIATYMDRHVAQHVFPFQSPPDLPGGTFSWTASIRAVEVSFELTRRRLEENADYYALALGGLGVRLNPELGSVRFADIIEKGRIVKDELRKRHGIA
jgi:hypothetical protein